VSTIPCHHLYNIHILVVIPRRVVDAFGPRFLTFFFLCLSFVFSCPCYLTISLRVGPLIVVSRTNGPGFASFFFLPPLLSLGTLLVHLILYIYGTYLLFTSDNFQLPFLYDLLSPPELVLVLVLSHGSYVFWFATVISLGFVDRNTVIRRPSIHLASPL